VDRIQRIVSKLAKGHVAYELHAAVDEPDEVAWAPLPTLSGKQLQSFEDIISIKLECVPEIGSRAFLRAFGKAPDQFGQENGWVVVQPGRYRYVVIENGGITVRFVLSEYLACEVRWE